MGGLFGLLLIDALHRQVHKWLIQQLAAALEPQLIEAAQHADAQLARIYSYQCTSPTVCTDSKLPAAARAELLVSAPPAQPQDSTLLPLATGNRRMLAKWQANAARTLQSAQDPAAAAAAATTASTAPKHDRALDVFFPAAISARAIRNAAVEWLAAASKTRYKDMETR